MNNDYDEISDCSPFDSIIQNELKEPINLTDITDISYCVIMYPEKMVEELGVGLTLKEANKTLTHLIGVYMLWIDVGSCNDESSRRVECIYVGKGKVLSRIIQHFSKKDGLKETKVFITFYECTNRIAKYLEQLLLDIFSFEMNISENSGEKPLIRKWDDWRCSQGTQNWEHADILGKKYPHLFGQP